MVYLRKIAKKICPATGSDGITTAVLKSFYLYTYKTSCVLELRDL